MRNIDNNCTLGQRHTANLALVEPYEHAHHTSNKQNEPEEVELRDVLTEGLPMFDRIEVEGEQEEN